MESSGWSFNALTELEEPANLVHHPGHAPVATGLFSSMVKYIPWDRCGYLHTGPRM